MRRKAIAASVTTAVVALFAVAILALSQAPANAPSARDAQGTPGPPYPVVGIAFDNTGAPTGGVHLNITNTRTGGFNNTLVTETAAGSVGFYSFDLGSLGAAQSGDLITIVANTTLATGTNSTTLPLVFVGYIWFNVTLGPAIPEFGDVLVPAIGMIGMFLTVLLVARVRQE